MNRRGNCSKQEEEEWKSLRKKYFHPEFDPKYRCKCCNSQDFRDCFERGTVDSQETFIHSSQPVYDSRKGSFSVFYREMRAHCEQCENKAKACKSCEIKTAPCNHKVYSKGTSEKLLRVTPCSSQKAFTKIHFITLEYLWKAHLLSVETSASMKGWLRSELIFKSLIYRESNDILTWDIWQAGESGVAWSGVTLAYKDGWMCWSSFDQIAGVSFD